MTLQNIASPEDQRATFIELFFDLVFVFSVTQVVGVLHGVLHLDSIGQAILVFWLVWWAWTQFTWALNAADTNHTLVEIGTLMATAVAFFMAVALHDAFQDRAIWFAVPYVLVRVIGLTLYTWVARGYPSQRTAVRTFATVSVGGLVAVVIGAIVGDAMQYWFWGFAIILDIIATLVGGQLEGRNLHPGHFGERHGLFVIIALGETLIVAGGGVIGEVWTSDLIGVAVLTVAITCGLWWSYFPKVKPLLEQALASSRDSGQTMMARDVFSLAHFPVLLGLIAYAFAVEEAIAHPGNPLPIEGRIALAVGLALFVGGTSLAAWRATCQPLIPRMVLIAATAMLVAAIPGVVAVITLLIALVGIVAITVLEQWTIKAHVDTQPEESPA